MIRTVCHVSLLDAAIVGNVLALSLLPLEVEPGLLVVLLAVLVDDALGAIIVLLSSLLLPPIFQVT